MKSFFDIKTNSRIITVTRQNMAVLHKPVGCHLQAISKTRPLSYFRGKYGYLFKISILISHFTAKNRKMRRKRTYFDFLLLAKWLLSCLFIFFS